MTKDKSSRSTIGRLFRVLRLLLIVVLGLLLVVAGLIWWRLSRGPISLDRFTSSIEELVDGEIAPLNLDLGGASLVWHGWSAPLEVRVRDVAVRKEDGDSLVTVAEAAGAVVKAPLVRGTIAPVWVDVSGVQAMLVRGEDGRIDLGLPEKPDPPEPPEAPLDLGELADEWLAPPNPGLPLGRLTTVRLQDAFVRLEDRKLGLVATAGRLDFELERGEPLVEVSIPLSVEIDGTTTQLSASATYRLDQGSIRARVDVPEVEPRNFAGLESGLEFLSDVDLVLALHAEAEISEELAVQNGEFDVSSGWGRVFADATFGGALDTLEGKVRIEDLEAWQFADLAPEIGRLGGFRHPLDAELEVGLEGGVLRSGTFSLQGSEGPDEWGRISGRVQFEAPEADLEDASATDSETGPPVKGGEGGDFLGDSLTGEVEIAGLKPWVFVEVSEVDALEGIRLPVSATGSVELVRGEVLALHLALQAGSGEVEVAEIYPEPLRVAGFELVASALDGLETIRLDRLAIDLVDLQPKIQATATGRDGRYAVRATAQLERFPLDRLATYWPRTVADETEEWVSESIPEGTVSDVVLAVAMDLDLEGESPVRNEVLKGSMAFDGLVLNVLAPKPPVEGIAGTATFEDWTLALKVTDGRLEDLQIEGADVAITGLDGEQQLLAVELSCSVEIATALGLLTGEPLDVLSGDELEGLNGQTEARVRLGLDLSGPEDAIEYTAHVDAREVSWSGAPLGLEVTDGELAVEVSADAVAVRGTAKASGVPAEIEYRQDLADGDPPIDVHVRARIDEQGLVALGLPEQPYLSGTTAVDLHFTQGADDLADILAELDFHDSQLDIPELDWQKPPGQDGGATVVVKQQSERAWSVERLDVSAGDLMTAGSVDFELDPFSLERLDLPHIELSDNRIQASVHTTDDDGYRIRVSGNEFHLDSLLDRLRRGGAQESEDPEQEAESAEATLERDAPAESGDGLPPLDIGIRFDQLFLSPQARLDGFVASAEFDGDHMKRANASATIEPEAGVSLTYGPADDGYEFEMRADSAGEVLAGLTGSGEAQGGTLVITGTGPSEAGPFEGKIKVKNVILTEQPVLGRILSLASLQGILDNLDGSGLKIQKGVAEFTFDEGILDVHGARIEGSGFLISYRGNVNFPRRQVSIDGAVAPLGGFQRMLGMIPLIGRLVTGWNKEGLIATQFTIRGPFDNVDVQVAPLSTLTPGILRDVFGVFRGSGKKVEDDGADADDKSDDKVKDVEDSDEEDKTKNPESG